MDTINRNFKKLRQHLNLTQEDFASVLSTTRSTVGAYEEGRARPSLEAINLIVKKCRLHSSRLYDFIFNEDFKPDGCAYYHSQKQEATERIKAMRSLCYQS